MTATQPAAEVSRFDLGVRVLACLFAVLWWQARSEKADTELRLDRIEASQPTLDDTIDDFNSILTCLFDRAGSGGPARFGSAESNVDIQNCVYDMYGRNPSDSYPN